MYQILHCELELYWEQVFQLWRQLSQTSQVRLINKELNKYVLMHGALLATGFPIVLNFLEVTNGPILSFISFFFWMSIFSWALRMHMYVCVYTHVCNIANVSSWMRVDRGVLQLFISSISQATYRYIKSLVCCTVN